MYGDILGIASSLLRSRREYGAQQINSIANAARGVAADLEDVPNIQTYVNSAAEQMDALSDYVTENSLEDMVDDATRFAKRYPFATAAFAVAAGFGVMRMLGQNSNSRGGRSGSSRSNSSGTRNSRRKSASGSSSRRKAAGGRSQSAGRSRGNGRTSANEGVNAS